MTCSRSFRSSLVSGRGGGTPRRRSFALVALLALATSACGTNTTTQATTDAPAETNTATTSRDDVLSSTATPIPQGAPAQGGAGSAGGGAGSAAGGAGSAAGGDSTDTSMAQEELTVVVSDGAASGDTGRQEISVGDTVAIVVSADVTDHVHVHGYDLTAEVAPDEDAIIVFAADVPGVFEVELEGAGLPLTELLVR